MEIKLSCNELINRGNTVYDRCYKRFDGTLELFSQLYKNKLKMHSVASVEAYKDSDALKMHFFGKFVFNQIGQPMQQS